MNQYHSVSAFDAHNIGILAAIRMHGKDLSPPGDLWSEEELLAWQGGVAEGCAIRRAFEHDAAAFPQGPLMS